MIDAINGIGSAQQLLAMQNVTQQRQSSESNSAIFDQLLAIDNEVKRADAAMLAYTAGEDIPVHELMVTMTEAKHSLELAVQVRNKLLEAYQEIARIQL